MASIRKSKAPTPTDLQKAASINVHSTSLKVFEKRDERTLVCQYVHRQSVGFEVFIIRGNDRLVLDHADVKRE